MKRNQTNRGFTLVELLTVVGIVVLLVAILVPAVNQVRISAKNTTSKATLGTLSTGLETFRSDQTVGGSYPPSASDQLDGSGERTYEVADPYGGGVAADPVANDTFRMSGAGLLVWALAGADLLGTPGFRSFDDDTEWWDDTHTSGRMNGAYALTTNTREPVIPRSGPFVDLSTVRVTRQGEGAGGGRGRDAFFPIPREEEVFKSNGKESAYRRVQRRFPVFLDAFDGPILYWKADPAGVLMADTSPNPDRPRTRGVYHFDDNSPLLVGEGDIDPLWLSVNRDQNDPHELRLRRNADLTIRPQDLRQSTQPGLSFARAIQDINVSARSAPQNAKSFLLWSAGRDGVFGNADDITNFKPFGGE